MNDIMQDFSPSAISQALDANEIAFWMLFKNHAYMKLHGDPEIFWFETGIRHDIFNRVLQTRFEAGTLPQAIERVLASFQSRRIPFLWHLGPSSRPAHLDTLLQSRGLVHYETEPGMFVDLLAFNEDIQVSHNVTVQPVMTDEQLQQWIRIWEFESSEEVIDLWFSLYSSLSLYREHSLRLYLGVQDGKPVATSAVCFAGGVASIGPIGTLPPYRGQGIGATMTLTALREARSQGYRIGVLTASPMGINIYRRIGFQQFCTSSIYLWHPQYPDMHAYSSK